MTWNKDFGIWAVENFESQSGSTATTNYQAITGGYVTLLPTLSKVTGYLDPWTRVDNWSFSSLLNTYADITGVFVLRSGELYAGQTAVENYQELVFSAGAWNTYSESARIGGTTGFSGQAKCHFALETGISNAWTTYFVAGGTTATIELEVASLMSISGNIDLSGYSSTQNNSTALDPIQSREIYQGIYIDNNVNWEYVTISPNGLQLLNHPEVALPIDLRTPKKIRIGIEGSNIYLSSSDGNTVVGAGKFDTEVEVTPDDTAKLSFGAAPITGHLYQLYQRDIKGIVGDLYWDNIKVLTGHLVINNYTGVVQAYPTSPSTLYTAEFDPGLNITSFSNANIHFIDYGAGSTVVVAQHSGATGWADYGSVELQGESSPYSLSLTDIPVTVYSSGDLQYKNNLRFKITQESNGVLPAPIVDKITLLGEQTSSFLDVYPTWKQSNYPVNVYLGFDFAKFYNTRPSIENSTSLYLQAPNQTGIVTTLTNQAGGPLISGSFNVLKGGKYGHMVYNHYPVNSNARVSSDAALYFGTGSVVNVFPNEYLSQNYTPISLASNYYTGVMFGDIADHLAIPTSFTGNGITNYLKKRVFRPAVQGAHRYNSVLTTSGDTVVEYAQQVFMPANSRAEYDGTEGIEVVIPSGIASGQYLTTLELQITSGSGVFIEVTGSVQNNVSIVVFKEDNDYLDASIPFVGTTGEIRIRVSPVSGIPGSVEYNYCLNRVSCNKVTNSMMIAQGHNIETLYSDAVSETSYTHSTIPVTYKNTVFSTDLVLNSYPQVTGTVISKKDPNGIGFEFKINPQGYPVLVYDLTGESFIDTSGSSTYVTEQPIRKYVTGESKVPLDKKISLGFCNSVIPYKLFSQAGYTGELELHQFAAVNKSYITIDGLLVAQEDNMRNWANRTNIEPSPYLTYIPNNSGTLVLMSGLYGAVDCVHLYEPIVSDAEVELAIKSAKNNPYYLPDVFYKPNSGSVILDNSDPYGLDVNLASLYSFTSPSYTNWDHGSIKNHLKFYGSISSVPTGGPYSGLGYTLFDNGGYAVAPYSSSFDKLFNTTGNIGLTETMFTGKYSSCSISFYTWLMPKTTGAFINLLENEVNPTGGGIDIGLTTSNYIYARRTLSNGNTAWSVTGSQVFPLNEWSWLNVNISAPYYTGLGCTGSRQVSFYYPSNSDSFSSETGANFGMKYYGKSGDSFSSAIVFGLTSNIGLCDLALTFNNINNTNSGIANSYTGNKSGSYNTISLNQALQTNVSWNHFYTGIVSIPPSTKGSYSLVVGAFNSHHNTPRYNGGLNLVDDEPFISSDSYLIEYDLSDINKKIGTTDSPISIGFSVPENSVNIGKISLPQHTVKSSISTFSYLANSIDLIAYQDAFTISRNGGSIVPSTITGAYKDINEYMMTGRGDVCFSGALYSNDILVTTISAVDRENNTYSDLYYYYLLGRGNKGFYLKESAGHISGQISSNTTGEVVSPYLSDRLNIRDQISITTSKGVKVPYSDYSFELAVSPFNPEDLYLASQSGVDIDLDGLRYQQADYTGLMPRGVYSVVLLLPKIPEETYWVSYLGYDYKTLETQIFREVLNPMLIYREAQENEPKVPGMFSLKPSNTHQNFDLTIYGMDGGYTGIV